ncbi:MAG: glycosyltransferase family 1 protein, partial [Legionella sp.]|nr:glycosyltransferase family 1 protein [Legionella sp.]
AEVIHKVLTDLPYANKIRTLGEQRYICFSWNKMAKQTLAIYEQVLSELKEE